MKKTGVKVPREDEWEIAERLILKEEKIYVPKNEELRAEIIQLYHNMPVAGYGGRQKTTESVTKNYQQPEVTKDVEKYVEGYDTYQRIKNRTEAPVGKLMMNGVPERPWTHLIVDFITKLLLVARKYAILVVCNRLSKIAYFMATIEGALVKRLVRLFRDNMWKLYGLPESVISDREPQFAAELTRELNKMLEIETKLSTVFYLQTDGQIEQINQEL